MKRTNIVLDEALIERGKILTGLKTQKDLINYALRELVRRKEQKSLLSLKGCFKWDGDLTEMRTSKYAS
jgi:Arc/MetJ family transcription regulator